MRLSDIETIVRQEWLRKPTMRSNVELKEFVLTPHHFRGIIILYAERNGESFVQREWLLASPIRPNSHKNRTFLQCKRSVQREPERIIDRNHKQCRTLNLECCDAHLEASLNVKFVLRPF